MTTEASAATAATTEQPTTPAVAPQNDDLNRVVQERDNWKSKYRELEQTARDAKALKAQLDEAIVQRSQAVQEGMRTQEALEGLRTQVRDERVNNAISTALKAAGARNEATVARLLDRSALVFGQDGALDLESVATLVEAVKSSDPYLFAEATDPNAQPATKPATSGGGSMPAPKRAAQADGLSSALEADLAAARKEKDPFRAIEQALQRHRARSAA
jgi:hypothetical protein